MSWAGVGAAPGDLQPRCHLDFRWSRFVSISPGLCPCLPARLWFCIPQAQLRVLPGTYSRAVVSSGSAPRVCAVV